MDWFAIIWLSAVALAGYWSASRAWHEWQTGVATYYFRHHFSKSEQPKTFWLLLVGRALGFVTATAFFVLGLNFFEVFK